MLVICALALVVAAAVFLVTGLAGGDVDDLYLSMVLCVASLVMVAVSARLSRVRAAPAGSEPPTPEVPVGAVEAVEADATAETAIVTGTGAGAAPAAPDPAPARVTDRTAGPSTPPAQDGTAAPAATATPAGDGSIWAAAPPPPVDAAPEVEPEPEPQVEAEPASAGAAAPFPIADYDDLAVEQILPLVPELWPEEVPVVAARERATKARPAVLDALAEAGGDPSLAFPIAEYESLDTEQITRLLARLGEADLATVQAAERSGPARVGVLVAVANQLAARK